jgi:hypothetical protein
MSKSIADYYNYDFFISIHYDIITMNILVSKSFIIQALY